MTCPVDPSRVRLRLESLFNFGVTYEKTRESTPQNNEIGSYLEFMQEAYPDDVTGIAQGFWKNDPQQNDKVFYLLAKEVDLAEYFYENNTGIDLNFTIPSISVHNCTGDPLTSFEMLLRSACSKNNYRLVNHILSEEKPVSLLSDEVFRLLFISNKIDVVHKLIKNRLKQGSPDDLSAVQKLLEKIMQVKPCDSEKYDVHFFGEERKADISLWMTYLELMRNSYPELEKTPKFILLSVMDKVHALGERLPRELQEVIGVETAIQEESLKKLPRDLIESHFKLAINVGSDNIKKVTILASHAFQAKANRPVSVEEKKICAKLILNSFTKTGILFSAEIKTNIIDALSEISDFTKSHIEEALKKVFG